MPLAITSVHAKSPEKHGLKFLFFFVLVVLLKTSFSYIHIKRVFGASEMPFVNSVLVLQFSRLNVSVI
jgi:hypothetical protein